MMNTPWSKRAEELEETEGVYAEYAAFLEWVEPLDDYQNLPPISGAEGVFLMELCKRAIMEAQ